ncbi:MULTISPECIES: azurin [Shewanella]|uniref:azurin n=1 Tax=Shewanella TaxID=22 RepID=UPI0004914B38|nr:MULTISPECIES: azurin [Shewanella]QLE86553.1 azurin [Shewanella sp. Scap07]
MSSKLNNKLSQWIKRIINLSLVSLLYSGHAYANECDISLTANDAMQFSAKTLSVPASCTDVTLTLIHDGKLPKTAMGHNWVLTQAADMQAVANDGMAAGAANHYVKPDDSRVIAHTEIIGGGGSTSISFSTQGMTAGSSYKFFCSFPGHWAIMQGDFSITE